MSSLAANPSITAPNLSLASPYHTPIMVAQILQGLDIQPGAWYVDATAGGGGHSLAILQAGGRVICLDQDQQAIDEISHRLSTHIASGHCQVVKNNFTNLQAAIASTGQSSVKGILFDLGVSSHQLDQADRGFSFQSPNLDMRMDQDLPITAAELLNRLAVIDLISILTDLGEERYAKRFAQAIDQQRQQQPINSGKQLAELLWKASPPNYRYGPIHPATRTFQALRLAVNAELDSLQQALPQAVDMLDLGGRLAVMSFHSLEDRIAKHFIQQEPRLENLTKKPIQAEPEEVASNPRSRSAKLRLAVKQEAAHVG